MRMWLVACTGIYFVAGCCSVWYWGDAAQAQAPRLADTKLRQGLYDAHMSGFSSPHWHRPWEFSVAAHDRGLAWAFRQDLFHNAYMNMGTVEANFLVTIDIVDIDRGLEALLTAHSSLPNLQDSLRLAHKYPRLRFGPNHLNPPGPGPGPSLMTNRRQTGPLYLQGYTYAHTLALPGGISSSG